MTLRLGFTGTQEGMTDAQKHVVLQTVVDYLKGDKIEAHHGVCLGADEEFHHLVKLFPGIRLIGHPPTDKSKMAKGLTFDELWAPEDYLVRNRIIVHATTILLATPKGPETQRSGTWYTVRFARKMRRNRLIIKPDGEVTVYYPMSEAL